MQEMLETFRLLALAVLVMKSSIALLLLDSSSAIQQHINYYRQ
jgi:hypothetical protein